MRLARQKATTRTVTLLTVGTAVVAVLACRPALTFAGSVATGDCSLAAPAPAGAVPVPADTATTPADTATAPADTAPAPADAAPAPPVVSYPKPSSTEVGPTTATVSGSVDPQGGETAYAFAYGLDSSYGSCTAAQTLPAGTGAQPVSAELTGLSPGVAYHFQLIAVNAAGVTVGADQTLTTAPPTIAGGVKIGGIGVGGLTRPEAVALVRRRLSAPLRFVYHGRRWKATPAQLGTHPYVETAVTRALGSAARTSLPLQVRVDGRRVRRYVAYLARLFSHPGRPLSIRLVGTRAVVQPAHPKVAVKKNAMTAAIVRALHKGERRTLALAVRTAQVRTGSKVIVVRLDNQSLTAYDQGRPVLKTLVTTGRPALPTPTGTFSIAFHASPYTFISPWPKGSPYYYPPAPVTWAMYFYDNDFLHDDPAEPASAYGPGSQNGPYASHGCIHVPHDAMRFLYSWASDGTTVIVAQS